MARSNFRKTILLTCTAAVFSIAAPALADRTAEYDGISAEALLTQNAGIAGAVESHLNSSALRKFLSHPNDTQEFYAQRAYEPLWVSSSRAKSDARDVLDVVQESWMHGLNPHVYHLEAIETRIDSRDQAILAELELLLTDAYLRIGHDLSGIRVNPASLKSHRRFWKQPLTSEELLLRLSQNRDDADDLIESFAPQGRTYKTLQKELVNLVEAEPEPYEHLLPLRVEGLLHPAARDPGVPALRARLGIEAPQTEDEYLYDDKLSAAVIRFQRENDLTDDGIVGRQTLAILNKSRKDRINQVIANLERLRWVEDQKPKDFVVVNIPSATLWAVEDNRVAFEMPVIVGRAKRPTNIFVTNITGIRLNPDWTVPPTIKKEDIVPKLQEDPEYLTQKGMQLISGRGEGAMTLDPSVMDWETMPEEELIALRMVQVPGDNNPLGRFRVHMPNSYNIYLHDTNEKYLFDRASRAVSSGCVRMKDPRRMADFILKRKTGWNDSRTDGVLDSRKKTDLYIQEPLPVYVLYYTAWLDSDGRVIYGQDLYDFDANLIKMLRDIDGIFIPVDNT